MYNKIVITLSLATLALCARTSSATKIDCHPLDGASKEKCEALGCVWSPVTDPNPLGEDHDSKFDFEEAQKLVVDGIPPKTPIKEPWCYFPDDYVGYKVVHEDSNQVKLIRMKPSGLPDDVQELTVRFESIGTDGSLLRLKIFDSVKRRFEPELPKLNEQQTKVMNDKPQFNYKIHPNGQLEVTRRSTGALIFNTDLKKLIFSDKFIQLNSKLSSEFVYGLGEHYDDFLKKADSYKSYSFYNADKLPLPGGRRSYSGFPFYINMDADMQNAHGVYLRNSNGMDIVLQPDKSITFRPIGGILDFVFFAGPTPLDVIKAYQHLVGLPDLPPRWTLGFHLCRYNYGTLEKTEMVWRRTREAGIPFDVQWNDIDNMERHNDFTYDQVRFKGLPEFIKKLHDSGMHYMILFDPGLSLEEGYYPYELGKELDIFVKNATGQTLVGKVWNDSGKTVFPDFSNEKSHDYWAELFTKFQQRIQFDGAWIDMNDISNFVDGSIDGCPKENTLEHTPYKPGGIELQYKTLCLSAKHKAGNEYDVHNLYSFYEAIATYKALQAARPNKRPFVLSRSSAPGQGHYGGHWSGDVLSTWSYLRWSIPSLIEHSMYGYSMMGSDICGFTGNTNKELCARWSTLGAFYTFSRNHNDDVSIDQDPVALGEEVVNANKNAQTKRYSLLPFLYSLIHRAQKFGEPVVRSVPFEFYRTDKDALSVEHQFMWGSALMISPIVDPGVNVKRTFLPKGRWYHFNILPETHSEVKVPLLIDSHGEWHEVSNIALDDIALYYRGGHILPVYRHVRQTVAETVDQPISLEVALCEMSRAHGELYLDDGDNVDGRYNHLVMKAGDRKLVVNQDRDDYKQSVGFDRVTVFGVSQEVSDVRVNGSPVPFIHKEHVLTFDLNNTQVSKDQNLTVEWS